MVIFSSQKMTFVVLNFTQFLNFKNVLASTFQVYPYVPLFNIEGLVIQFFKMESFSNDQTTKILEITI